MNKLIATVVFLATAACCSSCSFYRLVAHRNKSGKPVFKVTTDTAKAASAVPGITIPPRDTVASINRDSLMLERRLIDEVTPIWNKRIAFSTFTGKAKMRFEGPESKQEFTAHIRIKKDSIIWINITAALGGLSVARVYITPDSFLMLNYLEKEVTRMPLDSSVKILPSKVDFASLQNLIIGEPLRNGTITGATDFGGAWTLQVEDTSYIQRIVYNKSDTTLRSAQLRTHTPGGPQAIAQYGDYLNTVNGKISTGRVVNIQNGPDVYGLYMNFSKIDFDQPLEFPFSIPGDYSVKR